MWRRCPSKFHTTFTIKSIHDESPGVHGWFGRVEIQNNFPRNKLRARLFLSSQSVIKLTSPSFEGGHKALSVYQLHDGVTPAPSAKVEVVGNYGELGCAAELTDGNRVRVSAGLGKPQREYSDDETRTIHPQSHDSKC